MKMEQLAVWWVGVKMLEESLLCFVSKLKGRVADVSRVLPGVVVSPFMELTKSVETSSGTKYRVSAR
jgi:hypothetical protein